MAAPTAGNDVWPQSNSGVEGTSRIHKTHLHGHEIDVGCVCENIGRLAGAVPTFILQWICGPGTEYHRGCLVTSSDKIGVLEPTAVTHCYFDALSSYPCAVCTIGVAS